MSSSSHVHNSACRLCFSAEHVANAAVQNSDTDCCRISVLGIAFLIATITQLQAAFTRNFHYEMKENLPTWFTWVLIVTGSTLSPSCKLPFSTCHVELV